MGVHLLFESDGKCGFDGLEKGWGSAVFAGFYVVHKTMLSPRVCPVDGAAAGLVGHSVFIERGIEYEYACGAGSAEEFVGRKENSIKAGLGAVGWVHIYGYIRRRAREVHKTVPTVLVYQFGDVVVRCKDTGYVGTRSNCCYFEWAMGVLLDGLLEGLEVNESFAVGRNAHYVGDGFEPRGMV